MALNSNKEPAPQSNRPKTPDLEAGNYMGRVVQVLDLGLQPQRPFKGEEKPPAHEIMITYELGTEFLKDEEGKDMLDKPRWLSETFPMYNMSQDLAKSTKRMKAFDPNNNLEGDFSQLPGMTCTITVGQWVSKKDPKKTGNNVINITPAMKGMPVPELVNPPKVFDLDVPDMEIFGSLPDWLQGKMKDNLNFAGSPLDCVIKGEVHDPKLEDGAAGQDSSEEAPSQNVGDSDSPY